MAWGIVAEVPHSAPTAQLSARNPLGTDTADRAPSSGGKADAGHRGNGWHTTWRLLPRPRKHEQVSITPHPGNGAGEQGGSSSGPELLAGLLHRAIHFITLCPLPWVAGD